MSARTTGACEDAFVSQVERWAADEVTVRAVASLAAAGQVDEAWQVTNEGVRMAARQHFGRRGRVGKYQASDSTISLWSRKQQLRAGLKSASKLSGPQPVNGELRSLLRQWRLVIQELAKSRRRDRRKQVNARCVELEQCALKHEWAAVWRLSRKVAGTKMGPKQRKFDQVQAVKPSIREWVDHLAASGPKGGCRATVMHRSDEHSPATITELVVTSDFMSQARRTAVHGDCSDCAQHIDAPVAKAQKQHRKERQPHLNIELFPM